MSDVRLDVSGMTRTSHESFIHLICYTNANDSDAICFKLLNLNINT